jgi:hypothetical protein
MTHLYAMVRRAPVAFLRQKIVLKRSQKITNVRAMQNTVKFYGKSLALRERNSNLRDIKTLKTDVIPRTNLGPCVFYNFAVSIDFFFPRFVSLFIYEKCRGVVFLIPISF